MPLRARRPYAGRASDQGAGARRPPRARSRRPDPWAASELQGPDHRDREPTETTRSASPPAVGDGFHNTVSRPDTDAPEPTIASSWISGTTVRGRVAEVLPQQQETIDRDAESTARGVAAGCLMMPFRLAGFVLAMIFLKPLASAALSAGRRQSRPLAPVQVQVHPFRLHTDDGATMHCVMRGDLLGGSLSLGDHVEVRGRISPRTRILTVKRVVHLDSGAVVMPRVPATARRAKLKPWATYVALILLLIVILDILLKVA